MFERLSYREMSGSRAYFLRSARLGFGRWSLDDLALANALWGDTRVSSLIGGPFGPEQVRQRLEREIECQRLHGVEYWPVFLLADGTHVGCAGLRPYRLDEKIYELGFHLQPECWGHGLAQEAGRTVIEYAFDQLGATSLFAGHHPANKASKRVLEKLGFVYSHDELYPPTGQLHPSYLLARAVS